MSITALFDDAQRHPHSHKSLAKRLRKLEAKHLQKSQSQEFEQQVRECVLRLFEVPKSEAAGNRLVKFLGVYFSTAIESDGSKKEKVHKDKADAKQKTRPKQIASQKYDEDEGEDSMMTDAPDQDEYEEEFEEGVEDEDEEEEEEAGDSDTANAVANAVLVVLLPYLCAKDKTVRYRTIQLISTILVSIDEIDDDLYKVIRHELIKRLRDRVPAIRLEAVLVLGPLVENEMESAEMSKTQNNEDHGDEDSDYDEESTQASGLLEKLIDVLQNDTNAEVRRALLVNLPITPETLPYLMERARDKDASTRRAFYGKVGMQRLGDFRHLGMNMREKLLRWGLRDRDERVRKATARMFREKWVEDCARTLPLDDDGNGLKKDKVSGFYEASMPALLELLERIDVVNTGAEGGMAVDAMKEFWSGRPDYVEIVSLGDDFWTTLRAESAFMARTWIRYCQSSDRFRDVLEEQMPEVTRFGFHLQRHLNELTERLTLDDSQEQEEDTTEQEFVVEQLLHIAHTLDYTEEIGRRKMFSLLRNSISIPSLPEECTKLAVEALRLTCNSDAAGEKEFTSVVLEAIAEVHDTVNSDNEDTQHENDSNEAATGEEDSFVSARSEVSHSSTSTTTASNPKHTSSTSTSQRTKQHKSFASPEEAESRRIREILTNLKCLSIAHTLLQNIQGPVVTNLNLESMLESLILPSVRSYDAPVRIKALSCLGLCCTIEPKLAVINWSVFDHCLTRGDDAIKCLMLKVMCDILMGNASNILATDEQQRTEQDRVTFDIYPFVRAMAFTSVDVQNVATMCLGKLMLCGFYSGDRVAVFDEAVEDAVEKAVKGVDVLSKCRVAMRSSVAEGEKKAGDGEVVGVGGV